MIRKACDFRAKVPKSGSQSPPRRRIFAPESEASRPDGRQNEDEMAKIDDDSTAAVRRSPSAPPRPHLAALSEKARDYARNARSENTQRAYDADWRQFAAWLRRQGLDPLPPDPQTVGLYLAACVDGARPRARRPLSVRRWSAGSPAFAGVTASSANRSIRQIGTFRRCSPAFAAPMAARRSKRRRSSPTSCSRCWRRSTWTCAACATAPFWRSASPAACAARKSSASIAARIRPRTAPAGSKFSTAARCCTINGKTGWREVEIGRGSRPETCPVALLETWMRLGRINHGPLFRPIARKNGGVAPERLTDKHVARLVQKTALAAGIRGDLTEGERRLAFGGHSLRAGLASSAQIEEAHVQKHLGHASAEMTRRYQRKRDRFRVNLTKAAGL